MLFLVFIYNSKCLYIVLKNHLITFYSANDWSLYLFTLNFDTIYLHFTSPYEGPYDIAGILILDKSKGGLYTSFDRVRWDVMSIEIFKYLT